MPIKAVECTKKLFDLLQQTEEETKDTKKLKQEIKKTVNFTLEKTPNITKAAFIVAGNTTGTGFLQASTFEDAQKLVHAMIEMASKEDKDHAFKLATFLFLLEDLIDAKVISEKTKATEMFIKQLDVITNNMIKKKKEQNDVR